MDAKIKQKWIAALRSREYKQTQNYLQDSNGFCCLGVLCRVVNIPIYNSEQGMIKDEDADELNLSYQEQIKLTRMNDGAFEYSGIPRSFEQIADYIEENL